MKVKAHTIKSILRDQLSSALSDVRYARERVKEARALNEHSFDVRVPAVLKFINASGLETPYRPYLVYRQYSGRTDLSMTVKVDGLKGAALIGLIASLDAIVPAVKTDDHASEYGASRTFKFSDDMLGVSLTCDIAEDSETCRRVAVGTELKEVTKYAIICG